MLFRSVIRSPHKYKDRREHFEMRTHKRLIDIIDPTPKTVGTINIIYMLLVSKIIIPLDGRYAGLAPVFSCRSLYCI